MMGGFFMNIHEKFLNLKVKSSPNFRCRFHWMRDAGLSAKAWMDVNNNDYASVREVMEGYASCTVLYCTVLLCTVLYCRYASWTGIVQHKDDQYCDVRIRAVNEISIFLSC